MISIARFGRIALLALAVACASTGAPDGADGQQKTYPRTRIVFRQHYDLGTKMVIENYAGRDVVELRSRVVPKGEVPVAWVSDDVMKKTIRTLEKHDFAEYARPRPGDPKSLGVRAEVTVYRENGRGKALMRRHGQPRGETEAFQECAAYFRKVWTEHRPRFQATAGAGNFGVKRAGYQRGR